MLRYAVNMARSFIGANRRTCEYHTGSKRTRTRQTGRAGDTEITRTGAEIEAAKHIREKRSPRPVRKRRVSQDDKLGKQSMRKACLAIDYVRHIQTDNVRSHL